MDSLPKLGTSYDLVLANQHISFEDHHVSHSGPVELSYRELKKNIGDKKPFSVPRMWGWRGYRLSLEKPAKGMSQHSSKRSRVRGQVLNKG